MEIINIKTFEVVEKFEAKNVNEMNEKINEFYKKYNKYEYELEVTEYKDGKKIDFFTFRD